MQDLIAAWIDPQAKRDPAHLVLRHRDDGRIDLLARDQRGREVELMIPAHAWKRLAQEIGWDAPRREATLQARRLGVTSELPRPA